MNQGDRSADLDAGTALELPPEVVRFALSAEWRLRDDGMREFRGKIPPEDIAIVVPTFERLFGVSASPGPPPDEGEDDGSDWMSYEDFRRLIATTDGRA